MSLGTKIYELRARAGLSQDALAERLEVSRQSVSKWETDASVPELEKLIKLAELFGVSLDELILDKKPEEPEPPKDTEPPAAAHVIAQTPAAPRTGRLTAGAVLLGLGGLLLVLLTVLGGAAGILAALLLTVPFFACGIICLKCPKRPGLWCAWAVVIWLDCYLSVATGISSTTVLFTPRLIKRGIFSLDEMSWQLVTSGIALAVLVLMTLWTLRSFRKTPLPRTGRNIAVVAALWLARLAVPTLVNLVLLRRMTAPDTSSLSRQLLGLVNAAAAVSQDLLTVAAVVMTVAILRKQRE